MASTSLPAMPATPRRVGRLAHVSECEWPKGCTLPYVVVTVEAQRVQIVMACYCWPHFMEWLDKLQWRDNVRTARFWLWNRQRLNYVTGSLHIDLNDETETPINDA